MRDGKRQRRRVNEATKSQVQGRIAPTGVAA
jgi:hypothetical protein